MNVERPLWLLQQWLSDTEPVLTWFEESFLETAYSPYIQCFSTLDLLMIGRIFYACCFVLFVFSFPQQIPGSFNHNPSQTVPKLTFLPNFLICHIFVYFSHTLYAIVYHHFSNIPRTYIVLCIYSIFSSDIAS